MGHPSYDPQSTLQSFWKNPLKMRNALKKCKVLLKDAKYGIKFFVRVFLCLPRRSGRSYWGGSGAEYYKGTAMSKDENLMRPKDKIQKDASKMVLVLVPGAADASEGTVWVAEDTLRPVEIDRKPCRRKKQQEVEHKMYAEKQPGEGFWSIAPGCGDISEGMVWFSVIRKKQESTGSHPC